MLNLVQILSNVARDRRGISAVEYGVLGAVVVVAIFGGAGVLAGGITNVFGVLGGYLG
jgi:Flp pilus assembly pilin Flp